ncbi:E3 ubiquitin-protein ligase RNF34-like isoform X3 [Oncorhynchus nerka]|uniref:E3 ubiquitin-protein ligase RNF34-like isoform X3 n=1 Tax=Oncorhynchus nerka TaxID=8023 RepID=UPI0011327103|nr:E3 ubiquitin-protein ligase RNF34-like isoform X3 [Oncorhynchus nerka]
MYKAGASSMWASCCGLLNEVIGTGTVRGQQPGFGAGAGPFRFAPSAGYSTYPPTSAGSVGQLCKACGLAFSVFRRKENLRCCTTCHLLRGTAFQRPQLMALRVKDLRQYLLLRNIPTDTCREKEDLVDLVLCHLEAGENTSTQGAVEEEEDTDSLHSLPHSLHASPPSATRRSASEQSVLSASQGDAPLSRSDSSGTAQSQPHGEAPTIPLLHLEPAREPIIEVSPVTQRRMRASLSDLDNEGDIESLSVRQLKEILARNFVNYSGCCEKWELIERVHRLYRENEQNRKSMENVSNINSMTAVVAYPPPICNGAVGDSMKAQLASDDHLCRICMDAVIDCVLLECGHMVTCTKCGMRMSECPICRQYVVRAVHVFKS